MDKDKLVPLIQELASTLESLGVRARPELSNEEIHNFDLACLSALQSQLRAESELQPLDDEYLVTGGQPFQITRGLCAVWLGRRAVDVGAEQALLDLNHYLGVKDIPYDRALAIRGITLTSPLQLGNGIQLVPFSALSQSIRRSSALRPRFLHEFQTPDAVLLERRMARRPDRSSPQPEADSNLLKARLCLTLVGPSAPTSIAACSIVPPWVPLGEIRDALSYHPAELFQTFTLHEQDYEQATKIHEQFCSLPEDLQRRLGIPLMRLNSAIRHWRRPVEAAIDLGIAMEATFLLPDEHHEVTHKLSVRAGWYLGKDSADTRRDTFRLFHDLYKLRSDAVHSGRVKSKYKSQKTRDLLGRGFAGVAGSLRCIIEEQYWPDWDSVVFG